MTADLLLGMCELLDQLARVSWRLIWDNGAGIGQGMRRAWGRSPAPFHHEDRSRLDDSESEGIAAANLLF